MDRYDTTSRRSLPGLGIIIKDVFQEFGTCLRRIGALISVVNFGRPCNRIKPRSLFRVEVAYFFSYFRDSVVIVICSKFQEVFCSRVRLELIFEVFCEVGSFWLFPTQLLLSLLNAWTCILGRFRYFAAFHSE